MITLTIFKGLLKDHPPLLYVFALTQSTLHEQLEGKSGKLTMYADDGVLVPGLDEDNV